MGELLSVLLTISLNLSFKKMIYFSLHFCYFNHYVWLTICTSKLKDKDLRNINTEQKRKSEFYKQYFLATKGGISILSHIPIFLSLFCIK